MITLSIYLLVMLLGTVLCGDAEVYPVGGPGETVVTSGDDGYVAVFNDYFTFYGTTYTKLYININGVLSFGEPFNLFGPKPEPRAEPYFAAFWEDVTLDGNLGHISYSKATTGPLLVQAAEDLEAAGFYNIIKYVIVITWDEVQEWEASDSDPQNLFQVVLVVGKDCSLFTIFNYGHINWGFEPLAGFNKGDGATIELLPVFDSPSAATYSNIAVPGRVVKRVDEESLSQDADNTLVCTFACTAFANGTVIGYNQEPQQLPPSTKTSFSKTEGGINTDPCKFAVNVATDAQGAIGWVSVNIGVHPNPTKYKRSFALNRPTGMISERGHGISARQIDALLPYTFIDGATRVRISGDATNGWKVEGLGDCKYNFEFQPASASGPGHLSGSVEGDSEDSGVVDGACGAVAIPP